MPDREKVLQGLECCIRHMEGERVCDECPYDEDFNCLGCFVVLRQAIALLREQEPTTYAYDEYITPTCQTCGFHPFIAYIPTLERMEQKGYNYCPGCGRRVKW